MKVTRLGPPIPILNSGLGGNAGSRIPAGGNDLQVLTSNGSNGRYWGENVRRITSNGSNILLSPDVNIASGAGVIFSIASNTLTIASTASGGALTVADEGTPLSGSATTLDFTGSGVTASGAGSTKTINIPGGSGGVDWAQDISESGASFANFTSGGGTWSSNGTEIIQTDTAGSFRQARHNTKAPLGFGFILEAEVWFHAAGQGGGGLNYVSLIGAFDNGTAGVCVILDRANGLMRFQNWGVTEYRTIATTVNADTWYKLRMVVDDKLVTAYKDGVLIGTTHILTLSVAAGDYVGLGSYASTVKFRNIKCWTLSTGAPA